MAKKKIPKRQPVTWRAMIQRVNRYLKPQGAQLRSSLRGGRWNLELGPFYIVEFGEQRTEVVRRFQTRKEVAEFARGVEQIKDYEMVEGADYEVVEEERTKPKKGGRRGAR